MSTTSGNMKSFKVTDKDGNVFILTPVDTEARQAIDEAKNLQFDEDYFTADVSQDQSTVNVGLNGVPLGVDTDTPLKFVQDTAQGIVLGSDAPFATAIAPDYNPQSTYAEGVRCMYKGKLYRCTTAIQTAEAWTAAHWTEEKVSEIVPNVATVDNKLVSRAELSDAMEDGDFMYVDLPDEYNPLGLPPFTMRLKMSDNSFDPTGHTGTWSLVAGTQDTWDCTYESEDWSELFAGNEDILAVLGGNTSGVTNMRSLFEQDYDGNPSLETVALFDTRNVTDASLMFSCCWWLASVPDFNLQKCTTARSMFEYCVEDFVRAPKLTTPNLVDVSCMYEGCENLKIVPAFNTSKVTTMTYMFHECTELTDVPMMDTHNVTDMVGMFQSCSSLTEVPLYDTSNVTDFTSMFNRCVNLNTIPLFNTSSANRMNYTFAGCNNVTSGALALYQQVSTQTNVPAEHSNTFQNCGSDTLSGAAELEQIPSSWGGTAS